MTKALKISFLSGVLLLSASFHAAWAADEFGARFTHQAPAALGVSESAALLATQDSDLDVFSAETLNAIAPAAGGDQTQDNPDRREDAATDKPVE